MENDYIDIRFSIPIVSKLPFKLLKPITIPIIHNKEMIWFESHSSFLAVRGNQSRLVRASDDCTRIADTMICQDENLSSHVGLECMQSIWMSQTFHSSCLFHTTNVANTWIKVEDNIWAFVLSSPAEMTINDHLLTLNGSGLLSNKKEDFEVFVNDTIYISETGLFHTPQLNLSDWLPQLHGMTNTTAEIQDLQDRIRTIKLEDETKKPIVAHKVISGIGPYVCILLLFVFVLYRFKTSQPKQNNHRSYFTDIL